MKPAFSESSGQSQVYTTASEAEALDRFAEFSGKWEKRYPAIILTGEADMSNVRPSQQDKIGQAVQRGDWDAAVQELRASGAGPGAREDLRKSLAVCLANRAALTADKAMAALTPDETTRKRAAAGQALNYLFPGSVPGAAGAQGRARRPWRRRLVPHWSVSWSGMFTWLIFLSPIWVPIVLAETGVISGKTAGLICTIAYFTWFFGLLLLSFIGWVTGGRRESSAGSTSDQQASPGICEMKGCHERAQYEIPLGRIIGESGLVQLSPGQEPPVVTQRLCATHAHGLEQAMSAPVVNPEAVKELLAAEEDLMEAAVLDPAQGAIRQNLRQLSDLLARRLSQQAAGGRPAKGSRR